MHLKSSLLNLNLSTKATGLFLTGLLIQQSTVSQQNNHKNVLFLMADDFNFLNGLNDYYPLVKTPNIDKLARMGVYFADGHCSSPVSNPS